MMKRFLRILCWTAGTAAVLLLLAVAGLWSVRLCVWNGHVRDFYQLRLDEGPHVFREDGKLRVVYYEFIPPTRSHWSRVLYAAWRQEMAGTYRAHEETVAQPDAAGLAGLVQRYPCLSFDFLSPSQAEAPRYSAPRVAALSDIHGDVRHLEALLKAAGVVDERLNWNWGTGRLVVIGDVADKGPEAVPAFWLLRRLESQASASGGGVHVLLGNHEMMLLRDNEPGSDYFYHGRKYRVLERELAMRYGQFFRQGSILGDWLRTRNTVVEINGLLFVHGGVSRALLDQRWSLAEINSHGRELLSPPPHSASDARTRQNADLLTGYWGPYDYKGYFDDKGYREQFDPSVIANTLSFYQCRRIVVGHSTFSSIQPVRGGQVIAIGVKLPETDFLGAPAAGELLLVEGDHYLRVRADGSRRSL